MAAAYYVDAGPTSTQNPSSICMVLTARLHAQDNHYLLALRIKSKKVDFMGKH